MSERPFFSVSPETETLRLTLVSDLDRAKKALVDAAADAEKKNAAYEELIKIITLAVRGGQFDIAKQALSNIPTDAAKTLTSDEGKVEVVHRYKKDVIRGLLTSYADAGYSNPYDLMEERDRMCEKNRSRRNELKAHYAKTATEYRQSSQFEFFYVHLLKEIENDATLRSQLTETALWAGLFGRLVRTGAVVGVDESVMTNLMKSFEWLSNQRLVAPLKARAVSVAAKTYAGVGVETGSSFKTLGPLSGTIDIRRAATLLETISIRSADGFEKNQEVADAYYHIISCYGIELLEHGFSLKELEDIASRIENSLSKFSARTLLKGHMEMIREAAAPVKKAA